MTSALPTGTVTFLFTDVEGSTRLLDELGSERYAQALADHRRVLREAFTRNGGVEVDTQGDAFFFAFADAGGALDAARRGQAALEGGRLRVRMGVHTGDPVVTADGYVGADVHKAARIASTGHGGQVVVSEATRLLVGETLRPLGVHRLKDLARPEALWQLGDARFPPLRSLNQSNLPLQPTPFVGRRRELGNVLALLHRDDVRLLTLTGPGGSGKTRLALQAAADLVEHYPHGVWWVPLQALRDASLVEPTIAATLGVTDGIADHLAGKRLLLVLDNVEQLLEAAPLVAELVGSSQTAKVLVTSREALRVEAEHEYAVPPLADEDAVELFVTRAGTGDVAESETVRVLCRRLDNLPLALELAAARARALTADEMLERLERRLPLLTGGRRDAPDRQRTLRATIEWSYELLSAEEQGLFVRLSVFAGEWALADAEHVAWADLDTLQSLVDKSLVRFDDGRYLMLETIREFAEDQLEQTDAAGELRERHADHFLAFAERAEPELTASDQAAWLSRLDVDHGNLREALTHLSDVGSTERLLRLAGTLQRFWFVRGHLREGAKWLDDALEGTGSEAGKPRAKALDAAAHMKYRLGDYEGARRRAKEALALCVSLDDSVGIGRALNRLADVAEAEGEVEHAESLWKESAAVARAAGDEFGVAIATLNLGSLMLTIGDSRRATQLTQESLALFRQSGHVHGAAVALENLGSAALREGRYGEALPLVKESLALFEQLGSPVYLAHALGELAAIAALRGDQTTAARLSGAVQSVLDETSGTLSPDSQKLLDQSVAAARSNLSPDAFDAAWTEGHDGGLDSALDYVREHLD